MTILTWGELRHITSALARYQLEVGKYARAGSPPTEVQLEVGALYQKMEALWTSAPRDGGYVLEVMDV
jgi:hypothetical protein